MIAIIILKIYNKKNYEKFIIIFLKFWYIYMSQSVYIIQIYFNSVQTMSLKTSQSITLHL